jgi:cell division protein FtsI/penicillin-binding protein 2
VFDRGEAQEGDVITALEPTVQLRLEQELSRYQAAWHPKVAGGIVMDPQDGRILAMGVLPSFDLNDFSHADPSRFKNPLVENVYELGSIMKPITVAAGLDSGVITAETTYYDKGYAVYDGSRINNFDLKGRGTVPMQEVLNQSLNTGAAHVALSIGTKKFAQYLDAFGITQESGIDLPGEAVPLTANLESPRSIEYATASFGQGLALSPIAMTRALAVLGNGGVLITPHIATEIRYPSGVRKPLGWSPRERVISEEASEEITRMLVKVVDEALRDGTKNIPGYSVAAKTGTAQIAREGARGYYDDRFLHSFFGYFPAYDARFLIFLFAVEPQGARYASETLTDPFFDMTKFLITYYDIPPDRPVDSRQ